MSWIRRSIQTSRDPPPFSVDLCLASQHLAIRFHFGQSVLPDLPFSALQVRLPGYYSIWPFPSLFSSFFAQFFDSLFRATNRLRWMGLGHSLSQHLGENRDWERWGCGTDPKQRLIPGGDERISREDLLGEEASNKIRQNLQPRTNEKFGGRGGGAAIQLIWPICLWALNDPLLFTVSTAPSLLKKSLLMSALEGFHKARVTHPSIIHQSRVLIVFPALSVPKSSSHCPPPSPFLPSSIISVSLWQPEGRGSGCEEGEKRFVSAQRTTTPLPPPTKAQLSAHGQKLIKCRRQRSAEFWPRTAKLAVREGEGRNRSPVPSNTSFPMAKMRREERVPPDPLHPPKCVMETAESEEDSGMMRVCRGGLIREGILAKQSEEGPGRGRAAENHGIVLLPRIGPPNPFSTSPFPLPCFCPHQLLPPFMPFLARATTLLPPPPLLGIHHGRRRRNNWRQRSGTNTAFMPSGIENNFGDCVRYLRPTPSHPIPTSTVIILGKPCGIQRRKSADGKTQQTAKLARESHPISSIKAINRPKHSSRG